MGKGVLLEVRLPFLLVILVDTKSKIALTLKNISQLSTTIRYFALRVRCIKIVHSVPSYLNSDAFLHALLYEANVTKVSNVRKCPFL